MSRGKLNDVIETHGWPWTLDALSTLADNEADLLFRANLEGMLPAIRALRRISRQLHRASLTCHDAEVEQAAQRL